MRKNTRVFGCSALMRRYCCIIGVCWLNSEEPKDVSRADRTRIMPALMPPMPMAAAAGVRHRSAMRKNARSAGGLVAGLPAPPATHAQDSGWHWLAEPYVMFPNMKGDV